MSARWLLVVLGLFMISCSMLQRSLEVPAQRLPVAEGEYYGLAWLPSGWLVTGYEPSGVGYEPGQPRPTWRLWRFRPDGSEFEQLPLGDDPRCFRTHYTRPTTLPDGRVGFLRDCGIWVNPQRSLSKSEMHLMAYDVEHEQTEQLVSSSFQRVPEHFSWNPSIERGIISFSSRICATIAWLTRNGVKELTTTLEDEGLSWQLDEEFRLDPEERCTHLGRADLPAWSPDGQWIAFFASPRSIGVKDFARLDVPWNLYLMDPVEQKPRRVLAKVKYPTSLAWSPDSRWLAFGGEVVGQGRGLWLFAPSTGILHRVTSQYITSLAWSPDGQQIAGIWNPRPQDTFSLETEVWLFNVSGLVSGS